MIHPNKVTNHQSIFSMIQWGFDVYKIFSKTVAIGIFSLFFSVSLFNRFLRAANATEKVAFVN